MTNLEAYNEIAGAIRRAEYVDSDYADSVDVWALKVCERVLRESLEQDAINGKAVYRAVKAKTKEDSNERS